MCQMFVESSSNVGSASELGEIRRIFIEYSSKIIEASSNHRDYVESLSILCRLSVG